MKKSILISLLCATLGLSAQTQQGEVIKLWQNGAPNDNAIRQKEVASPSAFVSNVSEPCIIVFRPEKPNGAVIVGCPGGGYSGLAMNHEGYDFAPWLNMMGYTYVILKYRMPNGHYDVPLSDAEQAMRLVREHAAEWNIKTDKVGIMGFSAGGHLASTLATHYSSVGTRPDFQILFYPVITMLVGTHGGSKQNLLGANPSDELVRKFSNELQVNDQTPPAFIVLSDDDKAVPPVNSIGYYSALNKHGVSATMHIYPTGGHGWGFRDSFHYKRQWTGELEQWLRLNVVL